MADRMDTLRDDLIDLAMSDSGGWPEEASCLLAATTSIMGAGIGMPAAIAALRGMVDELGRSTLS